MSFRAAPPDGGRGRGSWSQSDRGGSEYGGGSERGGGPGGSDCGHGRGRGNRAAGRVGAIIVGAPVVVLTVDGPVAEVAAAVGAVSLSRPVLPLSRLLLSSRRAAIPS